MKNLTAANRWNADLIDQNYAIWLKNPQELSPEWRGFFEGFELGSTNEKPSKTAASKDASPATILMADALEAYRLLGHTLADIDPLNRTPKTNPRLTNEALGLSETVLSQTYSFPSYRKGQSATGHELLKQWKAIYCQTVGYEYLHIHDPIKRQWLEDAIETANPRSFSAEEKRRFLEKITQGEAFERFLHTRFVGQKRFSLEGGEALMAALDLLLQAGGDVGISKIFLGMAHRGRLNVLTNFVGKSHVHLFRDFTEGYLPDNTYGDGDVKYHLGYTKTHQTISGKAVSVQLAYNPSHLEAVNAIVEGMARAHQDLQQGASKKDILPLLIHGDAAVIGQGIVAEILNLARLKGYSTEGTFHIVINNQIGFTTNPDDSRSTTYCTDFAKVLDAPIFHVNGDDPIALCRALLVALDYRQTFGEDVFIDLICYRKYGHNETDEPNFTQPTLYKVVTKHTPLGDSFGKQLEEEGVLKAGETRQILESHAAFFDKALSEAKVEATKKPTASPTQAPYSFKGPKTAISKENILKLGEALSTTPQGFSINSKIERQLQAKADMLKAGQGIDWSLGEALAYASLLQEGHNVRLSGQDCERGTFSHRHAVMYDSEHRKAFTPLQEIAAGKAAFSVYNSALSEESVLGYEYGYSLERPSDLTLWEAQFGDFANGAQVMIDQFMVSGESKWGSKSNLTLLLPHGYEGQGPEHSSARLERFLQACAEDNIQVCNVTTPAQLFHLLRRQVKQAFQKPLVIMSPKSLLRHKHCVSSLEDFTKGSFAEILGDSAQLNSVERVVLCSGKVYYDLLATREEQKITNTAIIRIEQLYPLNKELLLSFLKTFKGFSQVVWCQEEPKNMGAYSYIAPILEELLGKKPIYAGRKPSASPACGSLARHKLEQAALLSQAFQL